MQRRHAMPFGAEVSDTGTRFALWAPSARTVALLLDGRQEEMPEIGDGWRQLVVPDVGAKSRYAFKIDGKLEVPDPASRCQPDDVQGASAVIDPGSYQWSDTQWTGRPWQEAVIYEAHVGTATPEGSFAGLAAKLKDLRDLGVTAIELMPLADFPGRRNWGYDGVLPFAPDASYGAPDDLKRLIDRAHGLGLMILVDVVYNHFGPMGNYIAAYARSFFTERHQTPWGAAINFEGAQARPVREFFIHNALYWLEEFHADGLRFDAMHAIIDDSEPHIIAEIATRARAALPNREIHLVQENEANEARWLERDSDGRPRLHTAQWSDDIHHSWHRLATHETEGYYEDYADDPLARLGKGLAEGFAYQGEASRHRRGAPRGEPSAHLPPEAFVAFLQNHDQIGNRAFGERLWQLADPRHLDLARAVLLLSPQIPLIFMGEEWSASTPFLYFVDFADEALSKAVREGRRREFARFPAFADPQKAAQIPDPTAPETFSRSILKWDERARPPHAEVLAKTRELLWLRASEIVPMTKGRFLGADYRVDDGSSLAVTWRFASGRLTFRCNLGEGPAALAEELRGRIVWASSRDALKAGTLPAWSGFFARDEP